MIPNTSVAAVMTGGASGRDAATVRVPAADLNGVEGAGEIQARVIARGLSG